jgi:hypothetical protein
MVDEGRREELVYQSQIPVVQDLFNVAPHESLVLCH